MKRNELLQAPKEYALRNINKGDSRSRREQLYKMSQRRGGKIIKI